MNANELTGLTVRVHPLLKKDPAGRTGQIGIITDADRDQDDYLVRFADRQQAHYSACALQVLQPPEKLYELMENRAASLSPDIQKGLHQVALLQTYGTVRQVRTAFELVRQNQYLQTYATLGLDEILGEHRSYSIGR